MKSKEDIAIVGIGCHVPGDIHGPEDFWNKLMNGVNGIIEVPEDRWDKREYYDPNPNKAGKIKTNKGGFIKNIDLFDNEFFNIFPKEAERIDPQQRLLLQTTFEAVEDAGDKLNDFKGSNTAVFMSVFMNDYWDIQVDPSNRYSISPHVPMGASLTSLSNRISYLYNLKGPSVSIDTACSGSLVAVHLACQSIWDGSAKAAMAGGANIMINPESTVMMSKGNFLSPDGLCMAFDEKANGYVRSEGVGVVYLKPLSRAIMEGNKIYGVIKATACNSDGYTKEGFTVPSESSQTAMLKKAYEDAGIEANKVQYLEAHGTGTPVGDPIETKSFANVFSGRDSETPLMIGSVKTNIGHLEGAAGVAGLIKLALSMKHKMIPGNLHFNKPNPKIDLENWKLKVVAQNTPWPHPEDGSPRVGGVNSFGAGGTNAHIVLEEFVVATPVIKKSKEENQYLFHTSAQTETALKSLLSEYKSYLQKSTNSLRDICRNIGKHRSDLKYRIAIAGDNKTDIIRKIEAYLNEGILLAGVVLNECNTTDRKIGFVFTGQGPQWYAMGQQLIANEPLFKSTIQQIETFFKDIAGWSLLEEMNKDEETSKVNDTRIAQPAIMAIQVALVELWKKHGVTPEGVIGHSIGEVAAAYAAGALTLEQAVQVIFHRSRGQHAATGKGKMLAASIDQKEAEALIRDVKDVVSIGAVNGPNRIVLSGDEAPLQEIAEQLESKDIFNKFLRVTVPFHSHHMEPLKEELISSLSGLQPALAKLDLYSTVTGKKEDGSHLVSEYWYENVRQPVYFANALEEMMKDGYDLFIEIGPHPALAAGAEEVFNKLGKKAFIYPSIRRKENEKLIFLQTLGTLYTKGVQLDFDKIYPEANDLLNLPQYTWDLKSFWYESKAHEAYRKNKKKHPLITGFDQSGVNANNYSFDVLIDKHIDPYVDDHKVDDVIIFPATGHLEIATSAAQQAFGEQFSFLEDINFESGLFLPDEGEFSEIKIEVYSDEEKYWILSRDRNNPDAEWVKHSNGKMNVLGDAFVSSPVDLDEIKDRIYDRLPVQPMYNELKKSGLYYGPTFRAVKNLWLVEDEILGKIALHESLEYGIEEYNLHPSVLDACLHTIFAAKMNNEDEGRGVYLPVHIDRYKFYKKPGSNITWSYVKVQEASSKFLSGDFWIMDEDGSLIAEVQGLRCKYLEGSRGEESNLAYDGCYEYIWQACPDLNLKPANPKILLISDSGFDDTLIQENLKAHGAEVLSFSVSAISDRDTVRKVLSMIREEHPALNRMLITFPLHQDRENVKEASVELSWKILNVFHAIIEEEMQISVWLVNAASDIVTAEDQSINIHQSVSYGLGRVMVNEYPMASVKIAELSDPEHETEIRHLTQIVTSTSNGGNETEFAFRGEQMFVKRLVEVQQEAVQKEQAQMIAASGTNYRTFLAETGMLDTVSFQRTYPFVMGSDDVEIDVKAAALNFKDVLNLMGLLSEESVEGGLVGAQLGLECSGVVARVGENVTHVKVGDEVIAIAPNALSGKVITPRHGVVKKPAHLSHEEGATITIVYLTAYYCMFNQGQMEAGERLLIHSATGGVGLAAIKLAQLNGIEIYATAGTEEKRELLRSMGVKYVYNSRTLDFYNGIMEDTRGEGVDLVLNSLSGKAIIQGLKCLRPFGRFVEIGKTDIYNDMSLHTKRFGDNLSYFVVDIDRLMAQRPAKGEKLFSNVIELFENKLIAPHPFKAFTINELSQGLDFISKGKHIGKVVINMEGQQIEALPEEHIVFDTKKSYILTGGASGFGLELAKWLAEKGAQNLALVSRSGPKSAYDNNWINRLRAEGKHIMIENVDLTSEAAVAEMVNRVNEVAPLGGIIHGAAVLQDSTIGQLDKGLFEKVFVPKAIGAWNLHLATEKLDIDFFLSLSSISSVFGLPGQSNYAAANNFLDKLVALRKSMGLRAQSVNLGVLGQYAGMSKKGGKVMNILENQGWQPLSVKQATSKIERILIEGDSVRMAANIDWLKFRDFFYHLRSDEKFKHLLTDEALKVGVKASAGESLKDQLYSQNRAEANQLLADKLLEALARILGTTADKLVKDQSVSAMGLDSLMMNQLRHWIQQKLEFNYPLMKMSKGPSIIEMADYIMDGIKANVETVLQDESGLSVDQEMELVNNWFVHKKSEGNTDKVKLFMFHSMGAGASMFAGFINKPPADTDIYAAQLPGRENRLNEEIYTNLNKLLPDLEAAIVPLLEGKQPFAIYGHSFGGIIAFELTRLLRRKYNKEPLHFFCSATMAPQTTLSWKNRDVMKASTISSNSEQKLIGLMSYIDDMDFVKKILPGMRRDMPLLTGYEYKEDAKFNCPITVFSAMEDEVTLPEEMAGWMEHTNAQFRQELVHGDHWFISRNKDFIHKQITNDLNSVLITK